MRTLSAIILIGVGMSLGSYRVPAAYGQEAAKGFESACPEGQRVLDGSPLSGDPFFFKRNVGPMEHRNAVKALLAFGPEAVPSLVTLLRSEEDRMHLYRGIFLLQEMAGINIYMTYERNVHDEVFALRDRFLRQWDSGTYSQADKILGEAAGKYLRANLEGENIAPRDLAVMRSYGVYAMPFLIRGIRDHDSPECYAAFLIITKQREEYAQYIKHPKQDRRTRAQKMESVKKWYADNRESLERVNGLGERVRRETAQ